MIDITSMIRFCLHQRSAGLAAEDAVAELGAFFATLADQEAIVDLKDVLQCGEG